MATVINTECIMCGACETECAEGAITAGDDQYVIDPGQMQRLRRLRRRLPHRGLRSGLNQSIYSL